MKKLKVTIVIVAMAIFAVGCGGSSVDNSSPKGITNAMYTQIQKGNYTKAAEIIYENMYVSSRSTVEKNEETKKQVVPTLASMLKAGLERHKGVKSFEIQEETISEDGETATVKTKFVYGDDSEDIETDQYAKQDGVWKFKLDF